MTVDQSSVTVEGQAGSEFVLPWFYDLVTLIGAGFASGLNCKAQASGGSSSFPLTISTSAASNATHLTMAIAASQLTPDDYTIMCSFSNTYPASTATLKVYNKQVSCRLTQASSTGSLDISYGPKAFLTTSNVFAVKEAARTSTAVPVSVLQITATVINSLKGTIMDDANDLKKAGDPMAGLILLKNLLLANLGISRRKRSADPVTPEINSLMLDFVNNTITSAFPSQEVLETLIEVLDTIPLTSLSNDDALRKLSLLEQILTGFEDSSTKMKPEYVESVKQFATSAMNDRAMGSSQFSSMSTTLKKASRKSLSFGTADEMSTGNSKMTYLVDVPGSAQASKSTGDAITVDFGTELTNTYSSWSCRSSSCLGVGIEMNHYDTTEDPYSTDTDRLSDVIDLNLFNPDSGDDLAVTSLSTPVTLSFPVTQGRCVYYNSTSGQ
ncbi:hypothetical protein ACOMHN_043442 [Nucella lapillus]